MNMLADVSGGPPVVTDGAGVAAQGWWVREAERLLFAERARVPLELLSRRRPGIALEDAYRVQRAGAALREGSGARVVGHKVGLTSRAMQEQAGIDEPDSGVLLDVMAVPDGGTVRMGELMAPRVEAEIAFRLGTRLSGTGVEEAEAWAAVAEVFLALEVIDSRFPLAGITLADSVADNAACARFVLGGGVAPLADLSAEELVLRVDGAQEEGGRGWAVLGDPVRSLVWLARRLAFWGEELAPGDVVLAGAVHSSVPLRPGTTVSASSPRLPAVSVHVR
ncbi:2-keto-4-pentenoate hydratase [Streptomyces sp. NPDC003860]